jgi:hypothetical protein
MNVRGGAYVPWVNRVSTGEYIPDATLIIDVSTAAQTDVVGWTVVGAAMLTFTTFAN